MEGHFEHFSWIHFSFSKLLAQKVNLFLSIIDQKYTCLRVISLLFDLGFNVHLSKYSPQFHSQMYLVPIYLCTTKVCLEKKVDSRHNFKSRARAPKRPTGEELEKIINWRAWWCELRCESTFFRTESTYLLSCTMWHIDSIYYWDLSILGIV